MAYDHDLTSRTRAALAHVPDVTEKRMFGSQGFLVRGNLCISARPERLMCRIDPALHDAAVERDGCQTVVMKGREYRGYVFVDADIVRTDEDLSYWIDLALAYNKTLSAKEKRT